MFSGNPYQQYCILTYMYKYTVTPKWGTIKQENILEFKRKNLISYGYNL